MAAAEVSVEEVAGFESDGSLDTSLITRLDASDNDSNDGGEGEASGGEGTSSSPARHQVCSATQGTRTGRAQARKGRSSRHHAQWTEEEIDAFLQSTCTFFSFTRHE